MAATSVTRVYDSLFSLTLEAFRDKLCDNIHKGIPFLWWLENRGRGQGMRMEDGGVRIRIPVVYAKNNNAKSYAKYDRIDLVPTEEITTALEEWSEVATSVAISRREVRQNSGRRALLNLLREKVNIAEMSMRETIESMLVQGTPEAGATPLRFIAGNSSKDILPLGNLIQKEFATASITVHGINQNTEAWWRNRTNLSSGLTWPGIVREMTKLYNDCSKGNTNDYPDLILADQQYFEGYETGLVKQQRYANYGDDEAVSAGFESLKFKGAVMLWSEFMPDFGATAADAVSATKNTARDQALFLNSRWLEWVVDEQTQFVNTPFEEPVDQTAIYSKILLMAQLTVTQRRKQGLHFNIDTTKWVA